jgi:hypothetical protein
MSKKQLLKRELNLHGFEIPPVGEGLGAVNPDSDNPVDRAPAIEPASQENEPDQTARTDSKYQPVGKDHTNDTDHTYEYNSNTLKNSGLKLKKSTAPSRRAKRRRGGVEREKWTTSLQPKFLEMLDVCSLKEGFRDMNEYVEYILARHARKIGYSLED